MPRLIVNRDVLRGGREFHELRQGEVLGHELRRLYPQGFGGPWKLYKTEALPDTEFDLGVHETTLVEDALYVVVVRPKGGLDWAYLAYSFLVSLALSAITYLLTPRHRTKQPTNQEQTDSPNNQVAGQSNTLRAGGRIPEIMGRVRSYPDLLTAGIEVWKRRVQTIDQYYFVGMGRYELSDYRLGETPIASISDLSMEDWQPKDDWNAGEEVEPIWAVRQAVTVNQISLNAQDGGTIPPVPNLSFQGAAKTMTSPVTPLLLVPDQPISITGTTFNGSSAAHKDFWLISTPSEGSPAPYVYPLIGAVVDESSANATIWQWAPAFDQNFFASEVNAAGYPSNLIWLGVETYAFQGDMGVRVTISGVVYRGKVSSIEYVYDGERVMYTVIGIIDMYGAPIPLPHFVNIQVRFQAFTHPVLDEARAGPRAAEDNTPTNWYVSPIVNAQEMWIDVAFPQGLSHFHNGVRGPLTVEILVEFKRGASAVVPRTLTYRDALAAPMRWTEQFPVASLGLPAGPEPVEVRLTRLTEVVPDTTTDQYIQDVNWHSFRAANLLPKRLYPEGTVIRLRISNSRSASSLGDTSLNCIATRKLPSWNGSGWNPSGATERWADNFVARCKADDGAHRTDAELDLAGIYAIQALLDTQDIRPGETYGDQGKISLTLDQSQDIDAELQLIASVVRCQVYRVGRKLFVTRDQGGKTPLALFTGRSKKSDGEQLLLSMRNDADNDAVIAQWYDRDDGWRVREYQYPEGGTPLNPLRLSPVFPTWAQAWRRSKYEWNRLLYRRDSVNLQVTEEGRLLHIGDVVNITDDVANLAQTAGELYAISGNTLELDMPVNVSAGGFTILLRAQNGRSLDSMAITQGADAHHVVLPRAPAFAIKGRDDSLGTMYAIYQSANAVVRPWLVTNIEPNKDYTRVIGSNWRTEVFDGDTETLPAPHAERILRRAS